MAQTGETLNRYRKSSEEISKALATLKGEKQAALPALRERAAEDVKEVAVRLSPRTGMDADLRRVRPQP